LIADERPSNAKLTGKRLAWNEEMLAYFRDRRRQLLAELQTIDREMYGIECGSDELQKLIKDEPEASAGRRTRLRSRRFIDCRSAALWSRSRWC
jgi:hypothetical protein